MTLAAVDEGRLEEERIRALESLGVLGTGREERFDRITRLAQRLFGVPMAAVMLIDREHSWAKSSVGLGEDPGPAPREDVFCNTTIADATGPTVVEDLSHDDRFAANPFVTGEMGLRFYAGHALTAGAGHAVGTLCLFDQQPRRFSATERAMLDELAEWAEAELNRSEEMARAAEMQQALLPREQTLRVGEYEIRGMCKPARSVGGDLIDYYAVDDDVVVTLGDVMGKGIGAALLMATVRSAVRTATRGRPPAEAIGEAARTLDEDLQGTGTLVTLCQARLTPETGTMSWSDAGHGLMVLVRADGTTVRPRAGGMPLGVLPGDTWPERTFVLEPGDTVVAFSDGLLDLFAGTDETFADLVAATRTDPDDVIGHVQRLAGDGPLDDDVTAVVLRRCP